MQLLHDRRVPRSRANIDHIAIAPTGVYVIDAKRCRGKIRVSRSLLRPPKLLIAGRDRTKLIAGLATQVSVVRTALAEVAPDVPVYGCLCFLDPEGWRAESGLPVVRTLKVGAYPLYGPRRLARRLNRAGELSSARARQVHAELAARLAAA